MKKIFNTKIAYKSIDCLVYQSGTVRDKVQYTNTLSQLTSLTGYVDVFYKENEVLTDELVLDALIRNCLYVDEKETTYVPKSVESKSLISLIKKEWKAIIGGVVASIVIPPIMLIMLKILDEIVKAI